jgi:hypothetical protein
MGQVTASVTVNFGGGGTADTGQNTFSAEVDSRPEGFNKGNTTFYPNDTVYILLYKGSGVTSVTASSSAGSVSSYSTATVSKTETITLANTREFRTSCPITGSYTITWYGTSPSVSKQGENLFVTASNAIAVGSITYDTTASVYTLSGVNYPAAVVAFVGETAN